MTLFVMHASMDGQMDAITGKKHKASVYTVWGGGKKAKYGTYA